MGLDVGACILQEDLRKIKFLYESSTFGTPWPIMWTQYYPRFNLLRFNLGRWWEVMVGG